MKNWKSKLASRKFWSAVAGAAVALCAAFGADEMTTQQITAVITAAGVLVAYIFAESYVDVNRGAASNTSGSIDGGASDDTVSGTDVDTDKAA